jgi:hypothetical protein
MKKYLFILILISTYSCKEKGHNSLEKKASTLNTKKKSGLNNHLQEIGNLYQPEMMNFTERDVKSNSEKKDFQVTLTNSDVLDSDVKNIEKHALKIASLYYEYLIGSIKPLKFKKIIVTIEHKNKKIDKFEYSKENVNHN